MTKEPLIVGIDPGITTAYAVLDTKGNLIRLKSSKKLNLSAVINEILQIDGKILAVGSDVKYPPHYITKFCSAFNTKLILPKEDMKVGFKERITSDFKTNDDHQRDALAAAVFAFNELRPLMRKVELNLKEKGKEHLVNEVKELVVSGLSITDSLEKLEKKDSAPQVKKRIRQKVKRSRLIFEENFILKEKNRSMSEEIAFLRSRLHHLEKARNTDIESRIREIIDFKDRKIASLKRSFEDNQKLVSLLKSDMSRLKNILLNLDGKHVLRRCKSLSKDLIYSLKEKEMIYIDDPISISQSVLDHLKDNGVMIVSKNKPSKDLDQAGVFIDVSDVEIEMLGDCVIIPKQCLEKKRNENEILDKIISEYKESRS